MINRFLAALPSTNFKIVMGETAVLLTVVMVNVCLFFDRTINLEVLIATYTFLAAIVGVSYQQFSKKRDTYMPTPPAEPDVEDGQPVGAAPGAGPISELKSGPAEPPLQPDD